MSEEEWKVKLRAIGEKVAQDWPGQHKVTGGAAQLELSSIVMEQLKEGIKTLATFKPSDLKNPRSKEKIRYALELLRPGINNELETEFSDNINDRLKHIHETTSYRAYLDQLAQPGNESVILNAFNELERQLDGSQEKWKEKLKAIGQAMDKNWRSEYHADEEHLRLLGTVEKGLAERIKVIVDFDPSGLKNPRYKAKVTEAITWLDPLFNHGATAGQQEIAYKTHPYKFHTTQLAKAENKDIRDAFNDIKKQVQEEQTASATAEHTSIFDKLRFKVNSALHRS